MTQETITPTYLKNVIKRIIKEVESIGCTQIQLCHEAGLKRDSFSKMKNPTINTIIKLIEAKERLKKKVNCA